MMRLMRGLNKRDLEFPDHVSAGAQDLISSILMLNPSKRLSLDDIMGHPWIAENAPLHREDD